MTPPRKVTIGRIVIYRSRTGNYSVPAIVTATLDTLAPVGLKMYVETNGQAGVPPLSSESHVHLSVLTPGKPGLRVQAQDFATEESPHGRAENVGGVYQEWDIPFHPSAVDEPDDRQPPGTWRWPHVHG